MIVWAKFFSSLSCVLELRYATHAYTQRRSLWNMRDGWLQADREYWGKTLVPLHAHPSLILPNHGSDSERVKWHKGTMGLLISSQFQSMTRGQPLPGEVSWNRNYSPKSGDLWTCEAGVYLGIETSRVVATTHRQRKKTASRLQSLQWWKGPVQPAFTIIMFLHFLYQL